MAGEQIQPGFHGALYYARLPDGVQEGWYSFKVLKVVEVGEDRDGKVTTVHARWDEGDWPDVDMYLWDKHFRTEREGSRRSRRVHEKSWVKMEGVSQAPVPLTPAARSRQESPAESSGDRNATGLPAGSPKKKPRGTGSGSGAGDQGGRQAETEPADGTPLDALDAGGGASDPEDEETSGTGRDTQVQVMQGHMQGPMQGMQVMQGMQGMQGMQWMRGSRGWP